MSKSPSRPGAGGNFFSRAAAFTAISYCLLFALLAWLNLSQAAYADDDAYIHFRIAENLIRHGFPYFNPGEPVMASSSSGWTLTLFLMFSAFGINLKSVSLFNAAVTALDVFVFARLSGELTGRDGPVNDLAAVLVAVPVLYSSSAGLMETPLALLVLGAGALMYARKKAAAFLLITASVFFRLELAVFLAAFLAHGLYARQIPVRRIAAYCILGAAPFLVYNQFFFGTSIPHTIAAKKAVYQVSIFWFLFMAFPDIAETGITDQAVELFALLALSAAALTGMVRHRGGRIDIAAVMLCSGLAVLLAYFLAGTLVFSWYVPLYALPVFFSLIVYAGYRRSVAFALLAAVVLSPFIWDFGRSVRASALGEAANRNGARVRKYLDVGARLYSKYPGYTLMSSEIGGLGYGFKGYIYDACGLASEGALRYHPMKVPEERQSGALGSIPPGYVRETMPDIIVTYDIFAEALFRSDVLRDYVWNREDVFLPDDMALVSDVYFWGGEYLNVFILRDKYLGAF